MTSSVEIVGVYPVADTEEPVTLVEVWIRGFVGKLDFAQFLQHNAKNDRSLDQVAYLEHALADDGMSGRELDFGLQQIDGDTRMTFFIHYFDEALPLVTPFGSVLVPPATELPARLGFVKYCEPD